MKPDRRRKATNERRGLLARPLDTLVFLLPLLLFYEIISLAFPDRVIAFDWTRRFFELFGYAGTWAPGVAVVVILLATHVASRQPWQVSWKRVGVMYLEAPALAIPLLVMNWALPIRDGLAGTVAVNPVYTTMDQLAVGIGAGIYEELVFRLVLISFLVMVGTDLFRLDRVVVATLAILLSSIAFSAHHHLPLGGEPFRWTPFLFRTIAGIYLAIVFWYRGYGPAAGSHAAYNVALTVLGD